LQVITKLILEGNTMPTTGQHNWNDM